MMNITIHNLQKKIQLNPRRITNCVQTILSAEGVEQAELSFCFVSSQKMKAINNKYLKHNYVTDVLTFDLSEGDRPQKGTGQSPVPFEGLSPLVGEIYICTQRAAHNAKEYKASVGHELSLYIVHGILHLLGYDDHSEKEIKRMRKKEEALIGLLGKKIEGVVTNKNK